MVNNILYLYAASYSASSDLHHSLSRYDGLEARQTSKPQNRRPLFDVELYLSVHKSFVSTSFKILCTYHLFPPPWGGGATQGDFTANVDTGGGMLTENRNLGWG
jgi:hypothetical protein